jgi:hypothetical protein
MKGDARVGKDAMDVLYFCLEQQWDPVFRRATVHLSCALAEGKIYLSLVGGCTMGLVLLGLFNSLTPKSVPAGTKLVLFGRYVLNIYIGIV